MTPFDPVALLAMLLAFYPVCNAAELARARRERPDYFAGGLLGGSHGDKMTLPDGSGWDLIFDVENATGNRHWQVIQAGDGGGGDTSPWPLEPGALTPIDLARFPPPAPLTVFEPLVAGALVDVMPQTTRLDLADLELRGASSPFELEATYAGTIADADSEIGAQLGQLAGADPTDLLIEHDALGVEIDVRETDYDEAPPPDQPPVPEPPPDPPPDVPRPPDQPEP